MYCRRAGAILAHQGGLHAAKRDDPLDREDGHDDQPVDRPRQPLFLHPVILQTHLGDNGQEMLPKRPSKRVTAAFIIFAGSKFQRSSVEPDCAD